MIRTFGIVNSHLYLARAGTTIDAVLVSETAMPDYSPASNWRKLSESITTLTMTPQRGTELNAMKTVGGAQQLRRKIRTGPASTEYTFSQQDSDMIIEELLMMTGAINDSAATSTGSSVEAVPFAGTLDGVTGWFQLQQYDQNNEVVRIHLVWGELMLDGGVGYGNELTAPKLKLTVFPNPLNRTYNTKTSASV